MRERPILFSGPMVRALLAGTKTQTRRIAKPVKHPDLGNLYDAGALVLEREPQHVIDRACPYGRPGDRLWVRETWAFGIHALAAKRDEDGPFVYAADGTTHGRLCERWRPSIHMPRHACRLVLEIVGVRVERLQAISEADSCAEGIPSKGLQFYDGRPATPKDAFESLWNEINGPAAWAANPWVWVVEFRPLGNPDHKDGGAVYG